MSLSSVKPLVRLKCPHLTVEEKAMGNRFSHLLEEMKDTGRDNKEELCRLILIDF